MRSENIHNIMTTEEWLAHQAERRRKEALYDWIERHLAWLEANPRCTSCDRRHPDVGCVTAEIVVEVEE